MGWGVLVPSALVAVGTAVGLRGRLPAASTLALLLAASVGVAVGGLLIADDPSAVEWVLAVLAMAFLGPLHARVVFGSFRRRG